MRKTFIISEIGLNHNGDMGIAKKMIEASKECGCDAVKFQTYITEKRAKKDSPIFDVLKKCELSFKHQAILKEYADSLGIEFFSTPFDSASARFLIKDLKVNKVKIASFDITNKKFLRQISVLHPKHIIMSVGMSNEDNIENALCALNGKYDDLTLMHCVSSYPMPSEDANLNAIVRLKEKFSYDVSNNIGCGYSDHSENILIPAASVLFGAKIIEKHFSLDLSGPYVDNPVSADPKMMKEMVSLVELYEKISGNGIIGLKKSEEPTLIYRRITG